MKVPLSVDSTSFDFQEGEILLMDKPQDWTSFDVVNKLKYAVKQKKIGHAGTLDPMATGLLVICTGKMTKSIDLFQGQPKEYFFQLELGKITPSYDAETEPTETNAWSHVTEADIQRVVLSFQGVQQQLPPIFSALKINGKRAYELARKGKEVTLSPREITIYEIEIQNIQLPYVECRVVCSKGTYIRSLIHDIGQMLGCGAYMTALRRTKIGDFSVQHAFTIPGFLDFVQQKSQV